MKNQLPRKTCSVDRMITRQDDQMRVIAGEKTATRRNGRYADIGETFECQGRTFQITNVYRQRLSEMTEVHFQSEGFANKASYVQHIRSVHKGIPLPWIPMAKVWVHEFEPVTE